MRSVANQQRRAFLRWKEERNTKSREAKCMKNMALHLILKPLLRNKERRLKQLAFSSYRLRVNRLTKLSDKLGRALKQRRDLAKEAF